MERQKNIYGNVNSFKSYKDRMSLLKHNEENLIMAIRTGGLNPYSKNENKPISAFEAIDHAI